MCKLEAEALAFEMMYVFSEIYWCGQEVGSHPKLLWKTTEKVPFLKWRDIVASRWAHTIKMHQNSGEDFYCITLKQPRAVYCFIHIQTENWSLQANVLGNNL